MSYQYSTFVLSVKGAETCVRASAGPTLRSGTHAEYSGLNGHAEYAMWDEGIDIFGAANESLREQGCESIEG